MFLAKVLMYCLKTCYWPCKVILDYVRRTYGFHPKMSSSLFPRALFVAKILSG